MGSRVLSLWLPYLATDRIRRDRTVCVAGPRATSAVVHGRDRLIALCPLAERARLEPGMRKEAARRLAPALSLFPSDRQGDHALLETIRTWCERYTPFAAVDQSHDRFKGYGLWLDIGSAAHLFGGEAHLLTDLVSRLQDQGLSAKAAIADHAGTAWAMARFGRDGQRILPVNGARVALASLPIDALRLDDEQREKLIGLGIERIEPLYALPREALRVRFGRSVLTRLEQALGLIDEPIAANAPLRAQQAQLIFAGPIMTEEGLRPSIGTLVRQLAVGLEAAGLGVRRLTLALYRVDGSTAALSIGSRHPSRDVDRLSQRLIEKVAAIDPGFGFERAILEAVEIEPLLPETIAWRGLGTGDVLPMRDLAFGSKKPPRRRNRAACAAEGTRRPGRPDDRPLAFGNLATALDLSPVSIEEPEIDERLDRPLRLLRQPEPIEAIAPLPDEPPILFRWRQGLHTIVRAQGPERVAPDWWRIPDHEQPSIGHELTSKMAEERRMRDYFAVEDSAGDRFWLFREGRYQTSQTSLPRWYLHGLFR